MSAVKCFTDSFDSLFDALILRGKTRLFWRALALRVSTKSIDWWLLDIPSGVWGADLEQMLENALHVRQRILTYAVETPPSLG
jgi:hypothetical protein